MDDSSPTVGAQQMSSPTSDNSFKITLPRRRPQSLSDGGGSTSSSSDNNVQNSKSPQQQQQMTQEQERKDQDRRHERLTTPPPILPASVTATRSEPLATSSSSTVPDVSSPSVDPNASTDDAEERIKRSCSKVPDFSELLDDDEGDATGGDPFFSSADWMDDEEGTKKDGEKVK